jgi:hypothetical protein
MHIAPPGNNLFSLAGADLAQVRDLSNTTSSFEGFQKHLAPEFRKRGHVDSTGCYIGVFFPAIPK